MENQHKHIKGYRDLDEEEISSINAVKVEGERLRSLIGELRNSSQCDQRWVSIAETHLQQGVMAAVRAIAKPEGF